MIQKHGVKVLIALWSIVLSSFASFGQELISSAYDSVMVLTIDDTSLEHFPPATDRTAPVKITGQAKLSESDIAELHDRLNDGRSYGQSQAVTPVYDLKFLYYRDGSVAEEMSISLWTNNLFATFPLNAQRRGECLCEGENGHCCTEGGISMKFKKFLIGLLEAHDLPVEKEEILNFVK